MPSFHALHDAKQPLLTSFYLLDQADRFAIGTARRVIMTRQANSQFPIFYLTNKPIENQGLLLNLVTQLLVLVGCFVIITMGNNACCADNRTSPETEQVFEEPSPIKSQLPKETITLPPLSVDIDRVLADKDPFRKQLEELNDPTVHKYKDEYFYGNLDEEGRPQGFGKMYKSDGSLFIGEFKNGVANGRGMFILPDGSYYEGQLQDNSAESTKGYFKSTKIQYQGGFRKNVFHGQGSQKGENFEFVGEYVNGKRKSGTFNWGKAPDQFSYVGNFDQNGKFTGKGKLSDPKGIYEGDFSNGIKQGYSIYRFKTQIRYEGYYKNNDKNGRGTIINKDGTIAFCGEFLNGLPHGKGYATDKKGKKHSIEWNEGVYADLV